MWKAVLPLLLVTIRLSSGQCLYPPCAKLEEPECPRLYCSVESLDVDLSTIELHVNWTCCESNNKNYTVSYRPRKSCDCSEIPQVFSTTGCETVLESRCLSSSYDIVITHVPSNSTCHVNYQTLPPGLRTLTAVALKDNIVRLEWKSSWYRDNWSFVVQWIAQDGDMYERKLTFQQSIILGPLDHDTNYTFLVESCDCEHHCSDYQTTWATTWSGGPNAPRDVHMDKITSEQILVRWKRPLHRTDPSRHEEIFDGYVVHLLPDEEGEIILPSSALKYRFVYLSPSTNYTIAIFAFKMEGEKRLDGPKVTLFSRTLAAEQTLNESLDKFKGELFSELRSLLKEELCK